MLNAVIAFFTLPPKIGRKNIRRRPNFVFPADFRPADFFSADFRRDQIFRRRRLNSAAEGSNLNTHKTRMNGLSCGEKA